LFSLVRASHSASVKVPAKFDLEKTGCEEAMYCAASCGPVYGFGDPLHPPHTPNKTSISLSSLL
jgi:hypothetical protein